ncbi:MAG: hypothetical protein U0804_00720 [Gemmataceae bacterium]
MVAPPLVRLIGKLFARPVSRRDRHRTARLGLESLEGRDVPAVTFGIEKLSDATEGGAAAQFRVTATGDAADFTPAVYAIWDVTGVTASSTTDYTASPAPLIYLTFSASGQTATVTVTATDDTDVEGDETATVMVQRYQMYPMGPQTTANLTLHDNDSPPAPSDVLIEFLDFQLSECNTEESLFHSHDDDTHSGGVAIDVGVLVSNVDPYSPPPSGTVGFTAYHQDGTSTALGTAVLGVNGIATISVASGILAVLGTELEASFTSDTGQSARVVQDGRRTSDQLLRDVVVTDNPTISPASSSLQVIIMGGKDAAEQAHWINSGRRHYGASAYIITNVHSVADLGNELAKLPKGSVLELIFNAHGNPNACFLDLNFQFNAAALNTPGAAASKQQIIDSFAPNANVQLQSCNAAANAAGLQNMQALADALRVRVWGPNRPVAAWDDGWNTSNDPWVVRHPQP